ncbi:hypothetical protein [Humisphaera borealis]|uniref:Uncharacterized protein n=1 Tax=Humisphaera borealis TaxID=2807512 RepID=A0A7M2WSL6_9BACT|nr:hypothetical protein [Humisphaera borealis]QOV88498.1 hypothetical protein IPV69_19945 [Humisphaera borealis]
MTHALSLPRASDERRTRLAILVLAALLALLAPQSLRADEKPADPATKADRALDTEPAQWMRFTEDGKGNGKLEVGVGTYKNDAGVTVHLVGAVHVGDARYYADLDKLFESYDALLYEMVKPKGAGAPARGQKGGGSMVSMFQRMLKDVLELDYQLDGIDYSKKNFVHADLDAEDFERLQEERGESIFGLMLQQFLRELSKGADGKAAAKNQPGLMEIIDAFNSDDRGKKLKLIMGRSFGDMEEQIAGFQGTVLVTERNKKALAVLKDAIRSGKKNIGVFYGAAHMPDMEMRLALMGFKRTGMEYKIAWDISDPKPAKAKGGEVKE